MNICKRHDFFQCIHFLPRGGCVLFLPLCHRIQRKFPLRLSLFLENEMFLTERTFLPSAA